MSRSKLGLVLVMVLLGVQRKGQFSVATGLTIDIESDFSCGERGNLTCKSNATTTGEGLLQLTPDPPNRDNQKVDFYKNSVGVALYRNPLQVLKQSTNEYASFSTSFSFKIDPAFAYTNVTTNVSYYWQGDGMTFVMFSNSSWIGDPGDYLGVYSYSPSSVVKTLAVEFDTFKNMYDIDDNHVGIDIESIRSRKARSADELGITLSSGEKLFAWIDYNASVSTLEVRLGSADFRPSDAFLSYPVRLSDVFDDELVWVGFSGSNGDCVCHSYYTVYDWKLRSSLPPVPMSAPSPSPDQVAYMSLPLGSVPSDTSVGAIAGGVSGGIAFIVLLSAVIVVFFRKRKDQFRVRSSRGKLDSYFDSGQTGKFTYKQLSVATNNFKEGSKLGQGGFGSVYRGEIPGTGMLVAVKRVNSGSKQGEKEYVAEVTIISQIRHRNIVQLLGWCNEGDEFLLVYELMPNGSLDKALYSPANKSVLPWDSRFNIVSGTAAALQYLHEGCRQQVIHRDVKSSNIMLDENFNAMLGDFGLARMLDHKKKPDTTLVVGTFGYIAPEVPVTGKFTEKTDIFAFGAVLLEVACGRKAYDTRLPQEESLLVDWVWNKLSEDKLLSAVDSRLEANFDVQQMELILLLGLSCSHPDPTGRPSIHQVLEILKGRADIDTLSVPTSKPEPVYLSDLPRYRASNRLPSLYSSSSISGASAAYTASSNSGTNHESLSDQNTRP